MSSERKYTSYCGLYCHDCIPSKKELFGTVERLEDMMDGLRFARYAELKAAKYPVYNDYPAFLRVLKEIKRLECKKPCYEGPQSESGCKPDCEIRKCVLKKALQGCWECGVNKTCGMPAPLKKVHPGIEGNLELIKKYDIDGWSAKRGKHYAWNEGK